jgi:hypothetical protein
MVAALGNVESGGYLGPIAEASLNSAVAQDIQLPVH